MKNGNSTGCLVDLNKISFRYRKRTGWVIQDLDFRLDSRPTVLIGPNGAGKSTTLRLMAGQLRPTAGSISRSGRIGFSPQSTPALPGFTVPEQVRYAGWLAGLSRVAAVDAAVAAIELANLTTLTPRLARDLSGGERARLGIACAIATNPDCLLLDEPTSSLDPLARKSVTAVLDNLVSQGIRLVITSHTATDVREPFQRLVVLDRGIKQFDDALTAFLNGHHENGVVADLAEALRGY